MAEYIKKDDAIAACEWSDADVIEDCWPGCDFGFSQGDIRRKIKTIPAADVAPVVHGKWIKGPSNPYYSECFVECRDETPFCPNCGAMMDGGTT
nr:MAG TPA: NADH-PPase NADH pyrophosphatase zinc ribbon domain [Caudoviricetes sp.]